MSFVSFICIGFIIFGISNGSAIQQKEAVLKRNRRSLMKLNDMFSDLTGHEGTEFLNYGNWCGLGGSGKAVDTLDACCESHDYCYDEIRKSYCKKFDENAVYSINYEWKKDGDLASCGENSEKCSGALCLCDVVLVNCLKSNLPYYNSKYLHKMSIYELLEQGDLLANM